MRTDRRTDRHDEANSCFRNFVNVLKYTKFEVFLLLFSSENLQCRDVNIQIQKKARQFTYNVILRRVRVIFVPSQLSLQPDTVSLEDG
jgi:hypothetical protein